jgi:GT2 family glycosyltransferase
VLQGAGAGPAAARNVGWRASEAPWVVFVDDDVVPTETWLSDLEFDLMSAPLDVVAVQGRVTVPLPADRRPTDWERNVTGLETARWITADMAVRRSALEKVGGFDERFPRAYREDADLALRLQAEGGKLTVGRRRVMHPVRPAPWWVSVRLQAGNRDDALMAALHGPTWQGDGARPGRRRRHLVTTTCGLAALAGAGLRRPALAWVGLAGWLAGTAELAVARILPGPRTPGEVGAMVATSVALPPVATWHWLAGLASRRRLLKKPGPTPAPSSGTPA